MNFRTSVLHRIPIDEQLVTTVDDQDTPIALTDISSGTGGTPRVERSVMMGVVDPTIAFILPPLVMSCPFEDGRFLPLRTSERSTIPTRLLSSQNLVVLDSHGCHQ